MYFAGLFFLPAVYLFSTLRCAASFGASISKLITMRNVIVLFFCVLLAASVQAQHIAGNVKDDQGKNTASASIVLKKAKDSAIVKLGATNSQGHFEFADIAAGKYFITVSYVGYASLNSSVFETSGSGTTNAPEMVLTKNAAGLKEVTVVSHKPIVEVKSDKIVLNVEGSINAVGQDALELLRKSPGVTIDKDDNLSLSGKSGVQVYIDGSPSPLTGKDLSEYLKTIQS